MNYNDMFEKMNTILIGLNNIDVRGKANVKNVSACIDLAEDVVRQISEAMKEQASKN